MDKKLIVLIIVGVLAVASLVYGIFAPSPAKRRAAQAMIASLPSPKAPVQEQFVAVSERPKRSSFNTWIKNPFSPEKREVEVVENFTLKGIVWDESKQVAIINDEIVKVGDVIGKHTVKDIKKNRVILTDGVTDLELRIE